MKSTTRTAALAFGLTFAGSWSLGTSDAQAQSPVPNVPASPGRPVNVLPPRSTVPVAPRYVAAPPYYVQPRVVSRAPGRPAPNTNYYPDRQDLKLYKPWLER